LIDESGVSLRPFRVRTWAPRGETPVLQYHFNWKSLSAIAGMTLFRFYFQLVAGSIRSEDVIRFLQMLQIHIPGDLIVLLDGLRCHRSKKVKDYVAGLNGRIELKFLPAYAPELNPVEYLWGYWKRKDMANLCAEDFAQLTYEARHSLRNLRRRRPLIQTFWRQSSLL
jgi:transposase